MKSIYIKAEYMAHKVAFSSVLNYRGTDPVHDGSCSNSFGI
jgi:hypothetical protein